MSAHKEALCGKFYGPFKAIYSGQKPDMLWHAFLKATATDVEC